MEHASKGRTCRYEHVKASQSDLSASSSSTKPRQGGIPGSVPLGPSTSTFRGSAVLSATSPEFPGSNGGFLPPARNAWNLESVHQDLSDDGDVLEPRSGNVADRSICSFASAGNCPRGEKCPHIHGDLCTTCGKHCLHPFRPEEREEHIKMCEKKQKHLEALKYSQEIECSVCLDRVLMKLTAAERKFGLLSECDHPFCVSCIRNWRSSSPSSGMDVNTALRTCPICRKLSYFVIPSVIWYSTPEEKKEIVDSYKAKLRSIDCKHFNFGNGNCPFGNSCFYKHAYRDGQLEEVALRHLGAEDGHTIIAKNIRLSDFLSDLHIGHCETLDFHPKNTPFVSKAYLLIPNAFSCMQAGYLNNARTYMQLLMKNSSSVSGVALRLKRIAERRNQRLESWGACYGLYAIKTASLIFKEVENQFWGDNAG
ncbi:E3 ubiquitin-protein ligase makorin [Hibiscus syriacus]|uniref:E3 ubiquitin-protein ligase makorin n=1 Tax=Hibiscus syriacus TaxID=106335 RepID=A0A6A3C0V5_HIBSY|nr:E3 ubiquitin-protein ligase makorin [Hibiscus syriacus]